MRRDESVRNVVPPQHTQLLNHSSYRRTAGTNVNSLFSERRNGDNAIKENTRSGTLQLRAQVTLQLQPFTSPAASLLHILYSVPYICLSVVRQCLRDRS